MDGEVDEDVKRPHSAVSDQSTTQTFRLSQTEFLHARKRPRLSSDSESSNDPKQAEGALGAREGCSQDEQGGDISITTSAVPNKTTIQCSLADRKKVTMPHNTDHTNLAMHNSSVAPTTARCQSPVQTLLNSNNHSPSRPTSSAPTSPPVLIEIPDTQDDSPDSSFNGITILETDDSSDDTAIDALQLYTQVVGHFPGSGGVDLLNGPRSLVIQLNKGQVMKSQTLSHLIKWFQFEHQTLERHQAILHDIYDVDEGEAIRLVSLVIAKVAQKQFQLRDGIGSAQLQNLWADLLEELTAWTLRLVTADYKAIGSYPEKRPRLLSERPLYALLKCLSTQEGEMLDYLFKYHDVDHKVLICAAKGVLDSQDGLRHLQMLLERVLKASYQSPRPLIAIVTLLQMAIEPTDSLNKAGDGNGKVLARARIMQKLAETLYLGLSDRVDKETESLPLEARLALTNLAREAVQNAATLSPAVAKALSTPLVEDISDFTRQDVPTVVGFAADLKLMTNYLRNGYIKLRVSAVQAIRDHLLSIFIRCRNHQPDSVHPVILWAADLLIRSQILENLFRIDSHPELISRTTEILNFLLVAKRFDQDQIDLLWALVSAGPDHRVAAAVFGICSSLLGYDGIGPEHVMMFCASVERAPIPTPNSLFFEFTKQLSAAILRFAHDIFEVKRSTRPSSTFFRLLCETYTPFTSPEAQAFRQSVLASLHEFAHTQYLHQDQKLDFLKSLVEQIAVANPHSISATQALFVMSQGADKDLDQLVDKLSLTSRLCDQICSTLNDLGGQELERNSVLYKLEISLEFFFHIIKRRPESLSFGRRKVLFDACLGPTNRSQQIRNFVWSRLGKLINHQRIRRTTDIENTTKVEDHEHKSADIKAPALAQNNLERLIEEWVDMVEPLIIPGFLNESAFYFLTEAVLLDITKTPIADLQSGEGLQIPHLNLLWRALVSSTEGPLVTALSAFIASLYFDEQFYRKLWQEDASCLATIRATHTALVEKCIQELQNAFLQARRSISDPNCSNLVPENTPVAHSVSATQVFTRISNLLSTTLFTLQKASPLFLETSAPSRKSSPTSPSQIQGEMTIVRFQVFKGSKNEGFDELRTGTLQTRVELHQQLVEATGATNFSSICSGQLIELSSRPYQTLLQAGLVSKALIIKTRDPFDGQNVDVITCRTLHSQGRSVMEKCVNDNFDRLYAFLDSSDQISQHTVKILNLFAPDKKIISQWKDSHVDFYSLFPEHQPLKGFYALRCLVDLLADERKDLEALSIKRILILLRQALLQFISKSLELPPEIRSELVKMLFSCMSTLIGESCNDQRNCLEDVEGLIVQLINTCITISEGQWPEETVLACFALILELAQHAETAWLLKCFSQPFKDLLCRLLLDSMSDRLRLNTGDIVLTSFLRFVALEKTERDRYEWCFTLLRILCQLVDRTDSANERARQVLSVANCTAEIFFREFSPTSKDYQLLHCHYRNWSQQLCSQNQSNRNTDLARSNPHLAQLAQLLETCLWNSESWDNPSAKCSLVFGILNNLLYPTLNKDFTPTGTHLPICSDVDRDRIVRLLVPMIIQTKAEDSQILMKVVDALTRVFTSEFTTGLPWRVARSNLLRSATGYVGLYNMGATCYMNSLFAQLFMNRTFRTLMIEAPEQCGASTPSLLLLETQKCFAWMENSYSRAVQLSTLSSCVRMMDGSDINPFIQMDAEEFFNLIFDQWESQFPTIELRKEFRSIYGGKQVTRTHSKDCIHISEREETFYNIQCSLDGVSCLEDSLRLLVKGEEMEGDNRYKCEPCGNKFVDAVRRTSFKQLPDHIILHLMRFTYDIFAQERAKNNNYFSFPETINMNDYTYEHLSDPEIKREADVFDLSGILLHTGSSESGHYISFVRVPDSTNQLTTKWVEFDDDDVKEFDPQEIPDRCFGGVSDTKVGENNMKQHCAYMLFYQRARPAPTEGSTTPGCEVASTTTKLPTYLREGIDRENTMILQDYCLMAQSQYDLMHHLVEHLTDINKNHGSGPPRSDLGGSLAKSIVQMMCSYLWRVLSRNAEKVGYDGPIAALTAMVDRLKRLLGADGTAWAMLIEWFTTNADAVGDLVLRRSNSRIHRLFVEFFAHAIKMLWNGNALSFFGCRADQVIMSSQQDMRASPFYKFLQTLRGLINQRDFYDNNVSQWAIIFNAHAHIAKIHRYLAVAMIDAGYLYDYLRLHVSYFDADSMPSYVSGIWDAEANNTMEKNREVDQTDLAWATYHLLKHVDYAGHTIAPDSNTRLNGVDIMNTDVQVPLTSEENMLLVASANNGPLWFSKILQTTWRDATNQRNPVVVALTEMLLLRPSSKRAGLVTAIKSGLDQCFSSCVRAALPILRDSGTNPAQRDQVFNAVVQGADNVSDEHRNALRMFILEIYNDEVLELLRHRIALTAHMWAPPILDDVDPPQDDVTGRIVYRLLHLKWLDTAGDIIPHGGAIMEVIRKLFVECYHKYYGLVKDGHGTREDLDGHFKMMKMCNSNLIRLREFGDEIPEQYNDQGNKISDLDIIALFAAISGSHNDLPVDMEENDVDSDEFSIASDGSQEV